jgi:hypothetical protein
MKKIILFIGVVLYTSCTHNVETKKESFQQASDSLKVFNGDDKIVFAKYEIGKFNYSEISKMISKSKFDSIILKVCEESKTTCKFILTYEPKKFNLIIKNNQLNVYHEYSAKNAMGVPGLMYIECYFTRNGEFVSSKFIDSE